MKTLFATVAVLALATAAQAQSLATSGSVSGSVAGSESTSSPTTIVAVNTPSSSSSESGSSAVSTTASKSVSASNQSQTQGNGNSQSITFTSPKDQTLRTAPQVVESGLTTSNDTCAGSASGALSFVGWGGAGGATYEMPGCHRINVAKTLATLGYPQEACEVMMQDKVVAEAFKQTGAVCRPDVAAVPVAPPPPPAEVPPPAPPSAPAQAVPPPIGERGQQDRISPAMAPIPNPA